MSPKTISIFVLIEQPPQTPYTAKDVKGTLFMF